MCIRFPSKKQRVDICEPIKNINASLINEIDLRLANFCLPLGDPMGEQWMSPEYDTENHSHLVLYAANDSDVEINASDHNFPNDKWIIVDTSEIAIKVSILVPIVLVGLVWNYALLYVILKFKTLRTPANIIIANMALVDFIYLSIFSWTFLINDFFQNYQFGEIGCKLEGWLDCALLIVNVINLSAISYDRLTAIVLPRETRLTTKSAKTIICFAWVVSCTVASPLILYRQYKERQWKDFLEKYCTENAKVLAVYWLMLLVILVWAPLAIMLICYIAIFVKLDRYEQKVMKREHPICVSYKSKVAKILFIVVLTFIACRMPFTALLFYRNNWLKKRNQKDQILGPSTVLWCASRFLMYLNCALDPLIYGLTNEKFRKAFRVTPIIKHLSFQAKQDKPKVVAQPRISIIKQLRPKLPEWKCDKWLNLDLQKSLSSDKQNSDTSGVGSRNNLIK